MKSSADDLLKIMCHAPVATAIYNTPDLKIAFANKKMLAFWDRDEQLIDSNLGDCFPEDFFKPFLSLIKTVWETGETISKSNAPAQVTLNGEYSLYYFDFEYKAILNDEGQTIAIIHTATDVTDRVLAENTIKETEEHIKTLNNQLLSKKQDLENLIHKLQHTYSQYQPATASPLTNDITEEIFKIIRQEEQLNFALQSAQMGTWTMNFKTKEVMWDKFCQSMLGPEIERYIPYKEMFQHIYPADREKVEKAINKALESPNKSQLDVVYRSLGSFSRKPKWLHSKGKVYFDELNNPIFLSGTLMDVTQQRLQREKFEYFHQQLIQREKELRQILDAAEVGIFTYKLSTQEIQINDHGKRWLQFDDKLPLTVENLMLRMHPSCVPLIYETYYSCLQKNEPFDVQLEIINHEGLSENWVRVLGTVHWDMDLAQNVIQAVLINITADKKEEKRKLEFLSIASHELKTPLTSVNAFLQLLILKGESFSAEQRKNYLDMAFTQTKRMKSLIERFLNLSQINENKLIIQKEKTTLQLLMRNIRDMYSIHANFSRLDFQDVEDVPLYIDTLKIEEVLNNFINNALKYSPQNYPIHINTKKTEKGLLFAVKDFGHGISEKDQKLIFDKFYRVNRKENMMVSGFGIGLYICKEIIQKHEGEIGVISDGKTGSTFWFTLPL